MKLLSTLPLLAALFLTAPHLASAGELGTGTPYCIKPNSEFPSAHGFPDGYVVKLGSLYFRICSTYVKTDMRPSFDLTTISWVQSKIPAQEEFFNQRWPGIHHFMIVGNQPTWTKPSMRDDLVEVSRVHFGDAEYKMFISSISSTYLERAKAAFAVGRQPDQAIYEFIGPEELNLPDHIMSCEGQVSSNPVEHYSCSISIRYRPSTSYIEGEFVRAIYPRYWDPSFLDSPFYNGFLFDFDNVPVQAGVMQEILESQDVTDSIENLRGKVEFIE